MAERGKKKIKETGKAKTKEPVKKPLHPLMYEIFGLVIIALAIIMVFEYGIVGITLYSIALFLFGNLHFVVPFMLIFIAILMMVKRQSVSMKNRMIIGVMFMVIRLKIFSHSIFFDELFKDSGLRSPSVFRETWRVLIQDGGVANRSNALGGGMIGALFFSACHLLFASSGTKIAAWVLFLIGLILVTGKALVPFIVEKFPQWRQKIQEKRSMKQPKPQKDNTFEKDYSRARGIVRERRNSGGYFY